MKAYDEYTSWIDCEVGDKVLVYKDKIFIDDNGTIDSAMVGTVASIIQSEHEDWSNMRYLDYDVTITLKSGKSIKIKEDGNFHFRKKYNFITMNDLNKLRKHKISLPLS